MAKFLNFKGSWPWPWPWIGSYCIPSCITSRPLPTCQMSLKSKKHFVDGRTDVRTGGRTFETHFIRSTQRSRPNEIWCSRDMTSMVWCDLTIQYKTTKTSAMRTWSAEAKSEVQAVARGRWRGTFNRSNKMHGNSRMSQDSSWTLESLTFRI